MSARTHKNKYLLPGIKLVVTGVALYWLIAKVELKMVLAILGSINPWVIVAGVALHSAASIVGAVRWWILFRHTTKHIPFLDTLPAYYLGLFFNNVLPSSVGGDVARTVHLGLRGLNAHALLGSAIMDRGIGLLITLLFGSISLIFTPEVTLKRRDEILLAGLAVAAVIGALIFFSPMFERWMKYLAHRYKGTRVRAFLLETISICHSYRRAYRDVILAVVLTLIAQSFVILVYYTLAKGLGIELSFITYFVVVPVVFLVASIPISVGGLGVREGSLVFLMTTLGAGTHAAVALSLVYLIVLWITSLPGGFVFLTSKRGKR